MASHSASCHHLMWLSCTTFTFSPFNCRSFLRSLDQRNISNGAAEMLKMACIKDEELFRLLEDNAEDMMVSKFQVRPVNVDLNAGPAPLPLDAMLSH
jgi:3-dehydroquinate synthase